MATTEFFLSIIIPSFRQGHLIGHCLESIRQQTYTNYEVIIIDGGSQDTTVQVVAGFADLNLTFVSEKDYGTYDAMNKGVRMVRGEWVYFIGCDDVLYDPSVLQHVADQALREQADLLYGDVILSSTRQRYDGEFDLDKLLFSNNICHQSIFYRKTIFDRLGLYNLRYPVWADWEFNIRCFRHPSLVIQYLDLVVSLYNDESGVSSTQDEVFAKELPASYINQIKFLESANQQLLYSNSYLLGNKVVKLLAKMGIKRPIK